MFLCWYLGLIGSFVGIIYCQDNNPLSIENEPDFQVILSVDTGSKSAIDVSNSLEPFACHECTNCNRKSFITTRTCAYDINMCYTTYKRINNINRVIRRGCSASPGICTVPYDDELNGYDSITCCSGNKCNQGIQFKPLFFLLILNLFILMINI